MRGRRLAALVVDVLLVGAPWAGLVGIIVSPSEGMGIGGIGALVAVVAVCGLASFTLVLTEGILFLAARRTVGMGCARLVVGRGSRGLSLLFGATLLGASVAAAVWESNGLDAPTSRALLVLCPAAVVGLDVGFLLVGEPRTLVDRMSGIHVERETTTRPRRGAGLWIDAVLFACVALPLLLEVIDLDVFAGAAWATGGAVVLLCAAELVLWLATRTTLGMRALGVPDGIARR